MIVHIEIQNRSGIEPCWHLTGCQIEIDGIRVDVKDPREFQSFRFSSGEEVVCHAKRLTFRYLERQADQSLPCVLEWRVYGLGPAVSCPHCGAPQHRIAKLGRYGHRVDLREWGCGRCRSDDRTPKVTPTNI